VEDLPWLPIFRILSYSLLGIGIFLFLSVLVFSLFLRSSKISVKIKVRLFHLRFFALSFGIISAALFFVSALITTTLTDSLTEKKILLAFLTAVAVTYFVLWLWIKHSARTKAANGPTKNNGEGK
jgi:putative copper export protein